MSAITKMYSDSNLTQELPKDASQNYIMNIGPDTGIDGNVGETVVKQFWIQNVGNEIHQSVSLTEVSDDSNRVSYSLDNITYNPGLITFGNIAIGQVISFYTKVTVEASALAGRKTFQFSISGESI